MKLQMHAGATQLVDAMEPMIWGITDGSAGMVSQVEGVLEALGQPFIMKTCRRKSPWGAFPVWWRFGALNQLTDDSDRLAPPWPRAVVTSGRRSAALALAIQHASKRKTRLIHLTDPRTCRKRFDLIVAMRHDRVKGPNVIATRFALHRVTPERLQEAEQHWAPRVTTLVKPFIAVLIGGTTNHYTLNHEAMKMLILDIQALLTREKGSVLITPSRRTGEANIRRLKNAFGGNPRVMVHDMTGDNPYMAMLALADVLVVTNDSVNMISEAASTGKPLYILPLVGHENTKPARFAEALIADGIARRVGERMQHWYYRVVDEKAIIAKAIQRVLTV